MPFVPVPKDLTKVKTKIAFNLTKRQLICFALAGAVGIPTYLFTKNYIRNDISVILMVTLMLPFFFFAMYEKDGQSFEKILKNFIQTRFLRPRVRHYQTENIYRTLEKQAKLDKEVTVIEAKTTKTARTTLTSRQGTGKARKKTNIPYRK